MVYKIVFHNRAAKQLRNMAPHVQRQLAPALDSLAENPRPHDVEKLDGLRDCYRVRSGDYRIVYTIQDGRLIVLVLAINDRKEAYNRKAIASQENACG